MATEAERDALAAEIRAEMEQHPTWKKGVLFDQLDADPKHRKAVRTMVADKFPETRVMMPETAVADAVEPALKRVDDKLAELTKRDEDTAKANQHEAWRRSLVAAGVPEAELDAAQDFAYKRLIHDPQAVALTYNASKEIARPTPGFGRPLVPGINTEGNTFFKDIAKDPDAWVLNRAYKDWDDAAHKRPLDPVNA